MKKTFLFLFAHLLTAAALQAQIQGLVKDEQANTIQNATVSLLRVKDSSLVKTDRTKEGAYRFHPIPLDSFLIRVSHIGFETTYSAHFVYKGEVLTLPTLVMPTQKKNLAAITVSARKALIDAKPNRTVVQVEGTVNAAGSHALELLGKSPGVLVDKDEQVSLNGKNGVQIFIDNRPTPLSKQDLAAYLKSIPSSQIEAIEIMSNPSAAYEASGTAGIINIRLKKNKMQGLNGSVNLGAKASANTSQEGGFTLNYRNQKLNAFGSYQHNSGRLFNRFNLYRELQDSAFDQQSRIRIKNNNHTFKAGLDYALNPQSTLGILVNGGFSNLVDDNQSTTPISDAKTGIISRILSAANKNRQQNNHSNTNLNYTYKDSAGSSLLINADYGHYGLEQRQVQPNTFLDASGKTETGRKNYVIHSPATIDIYALKLDYEANFAKGRIGLGGKAGYVRTHNRFEQFTDQGTHLEADREKSNVFAYREQVNALYAQYTRELKGLTIQAGLRAEHTKVKGDLTSYQPSGDDFRDVNTSFKKDYLDLFPNLSITLAPKTPNQFVLSYSRRIDRPVYKDLNPFEYRINEYTLHKGTTDMRPQYANTVSLTHTHRFRLNTTLSYSRVKDLFGQLVDTIQGNKGVLINRNLASQDQASLTVSYPFQYKQYSLFANVNTFYSKYRATFGERRSLFLDTWTLHVYAQNSLRLGKGWTTELSGFYASPSVWQGTMKTTSIWSVDAGVQKQALNGKLHIKAAVSDLFRSLKWTANSDFVGQRVIASGRPESRQLKISLAYRFGNSQVRAARQHQTGSQEESKRVQGAEGLGH